MKHFLFGGFRLEPANQRLLQGDTPVPLAPKAFDTLQYLVEHPGRLVTREELMQAIWPDSFVEGANLTVYISQLRKALGEDGERQYIETAPRKGYRLTVAVQVVEEEVSMPAAVLAPVRRRLPMWAWAAGMALVVAGLSLMAVRFRQTTAVRRVRLTSFGQDLAVTAAALSPDGKFAAYANAAGIFVQQIDTGDARQLAAPAPAFLAVSLSWFPDGAKVLAGGFAGKSDTPSLWVVQAMGASAPVKLGSGLNASVSPDGRQIAMSGAGVWTPPEASRTMAPEIKLMRSDGGEARTLVTGSPGETFGPVCWSADGRRLVWAQYRWNRQLRQNSGSLDSFDVASGTRSVVLTGSNFTGDAAEIAGGRIAYSQLLGSNPSSKYGAHLLRADSDPQAAPIAEWSEPIAGLSASAKGDRLMVRNSVVEHSVFVADWNAGASQLENIRRLTRGLGREDFPRAWTPDGKAIVFDSNRNGGWELFKQSLNASMDEPFVHSADDVFTPRLSPDHSAFLYLDRPKTWVEDAPVSVARTPVSGGASQLLFQAAGISEWGLRFECADGPGRPCVLAQRMGNQIVFRVFDPARGLAVGGEAGRVDFDPMHPVAWTVAPDGSELAWARWDAREARIHLVPLAGGPGRELEVMVSGCSHLHSLHWSADRKGWFLTSEWPSNWAVSYVDRSGRERVLLQRSGTYAPEVFPSPDGRRLAFSEQLVESNLWLLEGF